MPYADQLRQIKRLDQLVAYLRDELGWPIGSDSVEEITYDYSLDELGLDAEHAAKIKEIKQLRPLAGGQPWGIFWVNFEKKRLPVVVLRRILANLVIKSRAGAQSADRPRWELRDLLFISAYGNEDTDQREIAFAHFHQGAGDLPTLQVLGWDGADTPLKLDHVAHTLDAKLRWPANPKEVDAWRAQWSGAFRHRLGHVIRTADILAETLAALACGIRDRCTVLMRAESDRGSLTKLFKAFQAALIHDLTPETFSDTYAQTITYGLLTAAINRTDMSGGTEATYVKADDLTLMVRVTSPFLKEMLETFLTVGGRKNGVDFDELGIQEVVELLRGDETDLPEILRDFGNRTRREDPVIHFYEHFLSAYNKKLKVQRGVFYTPQPVVSYIVRSVHELLQKEFGLEDGLASTATWGEMLKKHPGLKLPPLSDEPGDTRTIDPNEPFVQILDPATGTATFLVEAVDVIYRTLAAKWKKQGRLELEIPKLWNEYVPKHLLPRLHGYELLAAPYAIAHLKLGLKLTETGYHFGSSERARIYLTNALEPKVKQLPQIGFEPLAHEAQAVNEIKWYKRFTVVIGNPPYTVMSANLSDQARAMVNEYRFVDGQRLKEKSMLRLEMHLQDDYIKFIRLGQALIKTVDCGVFGYVSNHSFLDNPTLRGMRQSLQSTFSNLWCYDLHGNSKKKDDAPSDAEDKNVFDIQQGVAISLAERLPRNKSQHVVRHADLFGPWDSKCRQLAASILSGTNWKALEPSSPFYLFVPQDTTMRAEFDRAIGLLDMMPLNSCGVVSGREGFTYDLDKSPLEERMALFCDPKKSNEWIREHFEIRDAGGYELAKRRPAVVGKNASSFTRRIEVKPFDTRWVAYTRGVLTSDQSNVMSHMLDCSNIGLITTRQTKEAWGVFAARNPIAHKAVSAYDVSSLFPLYLQPDKGALKLSAQSRPNYSPTFLGSLAAALKLPQKGAHGFPFGVTPEDVFHYTYAVFHSPCYRSRYAEFLKIDFPRLPLTGNLELFRALAQLGGDLVALHLLESPKLARPATEYVGGRSPAITSRSHLPSRSRRRFKSRAEKKLNVSAKMPSQSTGTPSF